MWVGGRSDAALVRAGSQGDGWVSYVVQPERYARSLEKIREAAHAAGRSLTGFTGAHLAFITVGRDYERARKTWVSVLSRRYAQDFEPLAKKYGVIGTPEQCAAQLAAFRDAGCTYFLLSAIGDPRDEREQLETIAAEVLPRVDRKSTRLNSSHSQISYAVFCLKKKKTHQATSSVPTAGTRCAT